MKTIVLTKGYSTIVDDDMFDDVNSYKWYANIMNSGLVYATRDTKNGRITMHRYINKTPKGMQTDHINRNSLDNRRVNLRTVTVQENLLNKNEYKRSINNTSGYKHIYWHKIDKRWLVMKEINGRLKYFGRYINKNDAIEKAKSLGVVA